jgi:opacity protein-like surface antigen
MIAKHFGIVMAAALLASMAATAHADEGPPAEPAVDAAAPAAPAGAFGGAAPYVSFGGVFAAENNSSSVGSGVNNYGGLSHSGGYDIRGGYNFDKLFAVELEWQSLVNFSTDGTDPVTTQKLPSLEARMLSLNGRISPLTGRFQPYGLVGMGWYNVQADRTSLSTHESAFAMRFGLGLMAYVTERLGFALEAAYILPMTGTLGGGDRFDLVPITASVFFRFK